MVNVEVLSVISPRCQTAAPESTSVSCGFMCPQNAGPRVKGQVGSSCVSELRVYLSRLLLRLRAA